jgi:hypothetical protein
MKQEFKLNIYRENWAQWGMTGIPATHEGETRGWKV